MKIIFGSHFTDQKLAVQLSERFSPDTEVEKPREKTFSA